MAVNEPERLVRGMYDASVDRPVITQENDIEGDFNGPPSVVDPGLFALISYQSVDPDEEVVEAEIVHEVDAEKVTAENPQSRFRVVDTAVLAPGTCILCKSSGGDGRQFVDLGIQVTWVGALYFCTFCVTEAAKLLGLMAAQPFFEEINSFQNGASERDAEIAELQEQNSAYRVLLRDHLNGDCAPTTRPLSESEADDASVYENPDDPEPEPESPDGDEQNADEPASEQGPDDVPAASGNDTKRRPPIRKSRPGKSTE